MTSRLMNTPVMLAHQARRTMAAQASKAKSPAKLPPAKTNLPEAKMTVSSSGARVVSLETPNTPLSTLGVVIMGGSRQEDHTNQGATQALRLMAGASTRRFNHVQVVRSFQQAGAPIQCAQGREHLMYAVQMGGKDAIDQVIDFFLESVSNQAFNEWEVKNMAQRINFELSEMVPTVKVNELLHRAAFRKGLGNPMFTQEHNIGKHNTAILEGFFNKMYTGSRVAIVGVGIDHKVLDGFASQLSLEKGEAPKDATKFYAGEVRVDANCDGRAYVALGTQIAGGNNIKEAIAGMVLQRIWGCGKGVKYSSGVGQLQKAVTSAAGGVTSLVGMEPVTEAFNLTYSDSSLIGVQIVADAEGAGKAVSATAAAIRSGSVTAEEVDAAKRSLLQDAYEILLGDSLARAEDLGLQALIRNEITAVGQAPSLIGSVTLGDVQAVAKKVSSAKLAVAAYGNLQTVPYGDTL